MRELLKLEYDLTRTAPEKYQEGAEVGLRTEEVKHCTAYLPAVNTATLEDCELYTLPTTLPDGLYVLQVGDSILTLTLTNTKAYVNNRTNAANIWVHDRCVDITAQQDNLTVTLAAVPTTNITASLVDFRRSSKDGLKDVSI